MPKIGINGFGRLGRLLLRIAIDKCKGKSASKSPMVVMINEPNIPTEGVGYLVRKDSFQGGCRCEVVEMNNCIMVDGLRIEFSREEKVEKIPWVKCDTEYIIDTTWNNTSNDKAKKFLTAGIKRVIVTGCKDIPMFVVGVNHPCFDLDMKIVSATTPSTNCLASMLRVLHENFEIVQAMATTLRPFNNSFSILDDPQRSNIRSCRGSITCMAPIESAATGKIMKKIMPELEDRTETVTVRVPVPCVGAVSLAIKIDRPAELDMINQKLREASCTYMKGLVRVSDEELVSNDVIGDCHSCVVDLRAGRSLSRCCSQLFAWYDSEYAFAKRLYDLAEYISSREDCAP